MEELVKYNLSALDVNYVDELYGRTCIMVCGMDPQNKITVDQNCSEIVDTLLSANAELYATDYHGWTGIMMAASRGMLKYLESFFKVLPDSSFINRQNIDGRTALMLSAVNGHYLIYEYLVGKAADITLKDNNGLTSLHYAVLRAVSNSSELSVEKEKLVDYAGYAASLHSVVDALDNNNRTALMYATIGRSVEIVEKCCFNTSLILY